jgi:dTDP-4-amino-4,6-dideoxygalactose transaminase
MFYIILPSLNARQDLMQYLREKEIISVFHYQPLHLSDMGKHFGGKEGDLPVTERMGDCLLRLPFYNALSESDQNRVIDALVGFKIE